MSIKSLNIPFAGKDERVSLEALEKGFYRVVARYGFMEKPDMPKIIAAIHEQGLKTNPETTSFYLG